MYSPIFTSKDLKTFLKSKGINWSGNILAIPSNKLVKADAETFNSQSFRIVLESTPENENNKWIDINLSNYILQVFDNSTIFNLLDQDYSDEWQNFLLNKYQEQYAERLLNWSEGCINLVVANDDFAIKKFKEISNKAQEYLQGCSVDHLI